MILVEQTPARNRTWDRDRMRTCLGNLIRETCILQRLDGCRGWRAPGSVKRLYLAAFRRIERKAVATDTSHQGVNDALHGHRSNRRIYRISPFGQNFMAGRG